MCVSAAAEYGRTPVSYSLRTASFSATVASSRSNKARYQSSNASFAVMISRLRASGLPEARRREIMTAKLAFDDWYRALFDRDEATVAEKEAVLNEYETGVRPYSAAALTHIGALQEALLARGVAFSLCRGIWPSTLRSNIRVA